ncbi:MAG TPA: hypothetical protein DCP63_08980 [Bacteroidetes bacterium]|nr:hypothetical protein [Bacteroidota bacterium]
MKVLMLLFSALVFESCMHLGMMGGRSEHQRTAEPVIEKEVTAEGVRAVAVFPPMTMGEPTLLTLRLFDASTGRPVSGAQVLFHAEYLHKVGEPQMPAHQHMYEMADSAAMRPPEREHDINLEFDVAEVGMPGKYSIQFTPAQSGTHQIMFHIRSVGEGTKQQEIIVEATRTVPEQDSNHNGGMHSMGGATPYVAIGAVLMGEMMIAFWAGGRMF